MVGTRVHRAVDVTPAHLVGNAVLYEGHAICPCRCWAPTSEPRFQYGVVAPAAWVERNVLEATSLLEPADGSWTQTQCLIDSSRDATFTGEIRYLAPRVDHSRCGSPDGGPSAATPQVTEFRFTLDGALATPLEFPVGDLGRATVTAEYVDSPFLLWRVTVRVDNVVDDIDGVATLSRDDVLAYSMVATHVVLTSSEGAFLSLWNPPSWATGAAAACLNVRTYPVLVGPEDEDRLLLSSPVPLPDRPVVAPIGSRTAQGATGPEPESRRRLRVVRCGGDSSNADTELVGRTHGRH